MKEVSRIVSPCLIAVRALSLADQSGSASGNYVQLDRDWNLIPAIYDPLRNQPLLITQNSPIPGDLAKIDRLLSKRLKLLRIYIRSKSSHEMKFSFHSHSFLKFSMNRLTDLDFQCILSSSDKLIRNPRSGLRSLNSKTLLDSFSSVATRRYDYTPWRGEILVVRFSTDLQVAPKGTGRTG